ncbi:hypothetical protein BE17_05110 [Sorangium cellulosum]|uniref:Amine oxidase domain-containing protein n=1 Tax=Sorangium cellulosum TaxID=56 RepID=A0A150R6A7_SORCE|nr:hypothetical protein BE17_05110 [Sorangium cellulosum]
MRARRKVVCAPRPCACRAHGGGAAVARLRSPAPGSSPELAERGVQVTVKEAAPVLGGRLHARDERLRTGAFRVERGLHMGFWRAHDCSHLLRRLDRERCWGPHVEVCHEFKTYRPQLARTVGPCRVTS